MLVLTEKPSVARDIAAGLGGFTRRAFGKHDGFFIRGKDCIVSSAGHLLTLYEPEDYDPKYATWKIEDLPILPNKYCYKPIPATLEVLNKIKYCFEHYDSSNFVLATDAEREGEYIGALLLNYVNFKNYDNAKRFWVSEALTPDVVKKGFENLKPLKQFESYKTAGYARSQSDWLIGINISRLLAVSTNTNAFFGRVQTAILGAIYLRDKSIANFEPVPYYQLSVSAGNNQTGDINFLLNVNDEDRFGSKDNLSTIKNNLGNELVITDIQKQQNTELQPLLFNLTGLQKYCSVRYKLTPEQTLNAAQILYEKHKCLSYPRTPSVVLGDNNVELFKTKFELLKNKYSSLAQGCTNEYISLDNKRLFNSARLQDHHALLPLDVLPENASENEKNVFTAVLERFFQTVKKPHIFESITIKAAAGENIFLAKGKSIIQSGWKSKNDLEDDELQTLTCSVLNTGDFLQIKSSEILEKKTKAKKHYTNASLLALMENPRGEDVDYGKLVGIGTPATRAAIIATLVKRNYIEQSGQKLLITDKGKFVINTLVKIPCLADLITINKTTEWEKKLSEDPKSFINETTKFLEDEIPKIKIQDKWDEPNKIICPLCHNGKIVKGNKNWYCSSYKEGCKFVLWETVAGAKLTQKDVLSLCTGEVTGIKHCQSKAGKTFDCHFILDAEKKIKFEFDK